MAVILGVVLGCGIREDEYSCEDAVSHLKECCSGFMEAKVTCTFVPSQGCNTTTIYPDFGVPESNCIRSESCSELVASGVCQRALHTFGGSTFNYTVRDQGVCP